MDEVQPDVAEAAPVASEESLDRAAQLAREDDGELALEDDP